MIFTNKNLWKAAIVAFLFLPLAVIAQQQNTLTSQEKADGWQLLFNGKDLQGWHSYLKGKPTKNWTVQQGAIAVTEKHNGQESDLVTNEEFENFDLKFEWKMEPCSNSGVMFYVHEDPKYKNTYETGPEMQIVDLACRFTSDHGEINDDIIHLHRAGALYDIAAADTEWVNAAPAWNEYEIVADNGHLKLFVNGHKVVETTMWDEAWWKVISRTKFKQWPDFGTFRKGHISFQGTEDGKIWFRNVKIKTFKFGPSS